MNKLTALFALGLVAGFLAGCASTPSNFPDAEAASALVVTNTLDPALLRPPTDKFVLGPGDQLDVEVVGNAATRATVTVGLDGKIYFQQAPGVDVWGLTIEEARARVEQELSHIVREYQVAMSLHAVGSKYVWLLGRVNRPGIYPLAGPMTLIESLALAGGTAQSPSAVTTINLADLRHSFVMRQGRTLNVDFVRLIQEGDTSQNIYLEPDDLVFIPSSISQEVYVLGAVMNPHTVPYADPMTIVSAIAGANGPTAEAYLSHMAIVRGSLTEPKLIPVDYKAILQGKAPNVILEPGDIVYVPLSPYRFIREYSDLIVTSFVRSWAANVGARAVQGNTSVNVAVPIGTTLGTGR